MPLSNTQIIPNTVIIWALRFITNGHMYFIYVRGLSGFAIADRKSIPYLARLSLSISFLFKIPWHIFGIISE